MSAFIEREFEIEPNRPFTEVDLLQIDELALHASHLQSALPLLSQLEVLIREFDITIMVLDDDPLFLRIAERCAKKQFAKTILCSSLDEATTRMDSIHPHVIIADFQLELESFVLDHIHLFKGVPLLLTSRRTNWIPEKLPDDVQKFVPKKYGAQLIVSEAIGLALNYKI